jgi:hypothetical protein
MRDIRVVGQVGRAGQRAQRALADGGHGAGGSVGVNVSHRLAAYRRGGDPAVWDWDVVPNRQGSSVPGERTVSLAPCARRTNPRNTSSSPPAPLKSHSHPFTARSLRLRHVPGRSRCEVHACGTDALGASVARRPGRRALTCLNRNAPGAPTAMHGSDARRDNRKCTPRRLEAVPFHTDSGMEGIEVPSTRRKKVVDMSSARRKSDRVEGFYLASLTRTSDRKLKVCCGSSGRWLTERL